MKATKLVVGLMSGTSLDGIDAALVEISGAGSETNVEVKHFISNPFPSEVRDVLLGVASGQLVSAGIISQLSVLLGRLYSQAVFQVCQEVRLPVHQLDLIGCHGQTIFHQPDPNPLCGHQITSTLQIGEAAVLAEETGVTTIADFRPSDMAVGGNGAPLIPFVDFVLFRDARLGRVLLNLGGIANITLMPPSCHITEVQAFDSGPGNIVTDALIRHFSQGNQQFDAEGHLARSGRTLSTVLDSLLSDPYFHRHPPKSAGREQFGDAFVKKLLTLAASATIEDLVCTATELTARTVAAAVLQSANSCIQLDQLVVSGGGVHNKHLMQRLKKLLPHVALVPINELGVHSDAKEALGFAILANETFELGTGNLPSVTGARHPVILGKVSYGKNYGKLRRRFQGRESRT